MKKITSIIGAVAAVGLIFGLAMLVVLLRHKQPEKEQQTIFRANTDGWILVGDKEGCKLYKKQFDSQGFIYWSICNSGKTRDRNSSITK